MEPLYLVHERIAKGVDLPIRTWTVPVRFRRMGRRPQILLTFFKSVAARLWPGDAVEHAISCHKKLNKMVLHQIIELVFTDHRLLHLVHERITKDASLPIRAWLVPVWFRHMGGLCIVLLTFAVR